MATTRIIPLHTGKGRTEGRVISAVIGYVENPEKTGNGKYITGYQCDSRTVDAEFLLSKKQYIQRTGRVRGEDDVIAYQIRKNRCSKNIYTFYFIYAILFSNFP